MTDQTGAGERGTQELGPGELGPGELGPLADLGQGITRIRAANPSPMTGTGTNSYVLHGPGVVAVIDPGPDLAPHLQAILSVIGADRVAMILVTHAHLDHSALARPLAAVTGAPVLAFGPAGRGLSPMMQALVAQGLTAGGEGIDTGFAPDEALEHRLSGQPFGRTALPFGTGTIEALHTPGHMAGHLCFAFGGTLFSGDHAMGWASTLVSPPEGDMGAYLGSLAHLAGFDWDRMLPGHGAPVCPVVPRLEALLQHRRDREAAIVQALRDGPATARSLAARLYTDTPAALLPAAARNVLAHLLDLTARNQLAAAGPLTADTLFHPN